MNVYVQLPEAKSACPTTSRKLLSEGALLVDVREPQEVSQHAFSGCDVINIPLGQFEARWSEVPRDRDVILACAAGNRSLKATYFLMYQGYDRVTNMSLGMTRWLERGFPVTGSGTTSGAAATASCCSTPVSAVTDSCCSPSSPAAECTDGKCGGDQTSGCC